MHILALTCSLGFGTGVPAAETAVAPMPPDSPRYELSLSSLEFSLLQRAAWNGVASHGGTAEYRIQLRQEDTQIATVVSIPEVGLLDVWTHWMEEQSSELLQAVDLSNLDERARLGLETARSVHAKLVASRANALFEDHTVAGSLERDAQGFELVSDGRRAALLGLGESVLEPLAGRPVWVTGHAPEEGRFVGVHVWELRPNTLELFVMADCPFGRKAERAALDHLRRLGPDAKAPAVEVRYIFYERRDENGATRFESLHGEEEIQESLVQILMRDMLPWLHHDYLLERCASDAPWEELARKLGVGEADIALIHRRMTDERDELLRAEFDYATKTYDIRDGSPTFVWEGRVQPDLRSIPGFRDVDTDTTICGE